MKKLSGVWGEDNVVFLVRETNCNLIISLTFSIIRKVYFFLDIFIACKF